MTFSSLDLAVAWGVMLLFDVTVFAITFIQAIRLNRLQSQSLVHRILTDGRYQRRDR